MSLLERTRTINKLLQHTAGKPVNFSEMAETLSTAIHANVFIVSRRGKILGYGMVEKLEASRLTSMIEKRLFPETYTMSLKDIAETSANLDVNDIHTVFPIESKE